MTAVIGVQLMNIKSVDMTLVQRILDGPTKHYPNSNGVETSWREPHGHIYHHISYPLMSTPDKYPPVVSPGWGPTPKNKIFFFKIELGVPNHVRKTRKTHIIICDFLDSECKIILQNLANRKNIKSGCTQGLQI